LLQDYRIHHEELCSKLVSIMRERLSINLKQLPAQAAAWSGGGGGGGGGQHRPLDDPGDQPPPSAFAATCAKQLTILSGALAPLLLPAELHGILGRIALMFSRTLSEAYELLEPHGPAWEQQLRADVQVCVCVCLHCCWVSLLLALPARAALPLCACLRACPPALQGCVYAACAVERVHMALSVQIFPACC
jgi:hypothetical protein